MEEIKTVSQWKREVKPVLVSKVDELHLMGYERATINDIWQCLVKKVWKGDAEKRLYEIVQDIFHLPSHTYISYLTSEAYQNEDLKSSIEAVHKEVHEE